MLGRWVVCDAIYLHCRDSPQYSSLFFRESFKTDFKLYKLMWVILNGKYNHKAQGWASVPVSKNHGMLSTAPIPNNEMIHFFLFLSKFRYYV